MAEGEDKRHDPSERRLNDAAEKGELPRSPELTAVASIIAVAAALTFGAATVAAPVVAFARHAFAPGLRMDSGAAHGLLQAGLWAIASAALPALGAAGLAATAIGLAQTRFSIAPRAFEARLEHLDPFATFARLYMSRQPFVELAKGVLHVGAFGAVTGWVIWDRLGELPALAASPPAVQLALMVDLAWDLVVTSLPVMAALGAIDYAWAHWTWWQGLMLSDQEAREEAREQEGDPHVKAQRRRRMRELSQRQVVKQIATANVLITNPTHYAVALRYRHGVDAAPVVVAKGVDHLAAKLRQEAFRLGIPRVEERLLARSLYAAVPLGKAVPAALFGPVARVLAVIYRRRSAVSPSPSRPSRSS